MRLFGFGKKSRYVPTALDIFEDEHADECYAFCDKMETKIWNVKLDHADPDKNLAGFEKQLSLAEEIKAFCCSLGAGGEEFFEREFSHIVDDIKSDQADYIQNQYAEDQAAFESLKLEKAAIRKLSASILKEIRSAGGSVFQKDLKKNIPPDLSQYFEKTVRSLCDSGKLSKVKDGAFIRLEIQ